MTRKLTLVGRALFCCFNILFLFSASAQDNSCTDIHNVKLERLIDRGISNAYINGNQNLENVWEKLDFKPGAGYKSGIPNDLVTKKVVLRLNLCNSGDSAVSAYFFPGVYYRNIRIFKSGPEGIKALPSILPDNSDSIGFRLISMEPHDSAIFFAELSFARTYVNSLNPRLVNPDYVGAFMASLRSSRDHNYLFTYVFSGLLLMMIFFSFSNFLQEGTKEFLYYSGYAFFLGLMLFTKAVFNYRINHLSFFLEGYLDFILQGLGIIFYMLFMQKFLDTRSRHPFLFYLYRGGIVMMTVSLTAFTFFHFFTSNFGAENAIENITKIILLVMILIFLGYGLRRHSEKLLRYLFWGNFFLFIFSLVSQLFVMFNPKLPHFPSFMRSALFYYELGILLELFLFLAALNYKTRLQIIGQTRERERLSAENQLKEYEKEMAVYKAQQNERERISADMHDELGSGMTVIRLMSEIARNKMKDQTPVEIQKISESANDVLNKMNVIIWSMNSGNDTLDNLISYIRAYCLEYFENTPIHSRVMAPENIPVIELSGDKRRNIFLAVKETLNNTLKHSQATQVTIDIEINHRLFVKIADNGTGIDLNNLRLFGNGLKNIGNRMKSIGGSFKISNDGGTATELELPV